MDDGDVFRGTPAAPSLTLTRAGTFSTIDSFERRLSRAAIARMRRAASGVAFSAAFSSFSACVNSLCVSTRRVCGSEEKGFPTSGVCGLR